MAEKDTLTDVGLPILGKGAGKLLKFMATGDDYATVAASQTTQLLGATGAVGDYLVGVLIIPTTTGAGLVSIRDGNGSDIVIFNTGTLSDLKPFYVLINARCRATATPGWRITTGANVTAIANGSFT